MSRSALARGDKQPNAVLHPHKELWLTLPPSLLLLYLPGSRGKTESEFAHVNASPNHAGGSSVPARASVPFQSSARDFMWDSWTQRIWAPQWRHSQLRHGASRDTPNNVWPQWPPAYSGLQAFGWQSWTGVRRREGVSYDEVYPQSTAPLRDLLHKTIDISIKMEAQEVKAANAPPRICFTMCYTIWASQWVEIKEGQMMSWVTLRSSPEIDNLSSPVWTMPLGITYSFILSQFLWQLLPKLPEK